MSRCRTAIALGWYPELYNASGTTPSPAEAPGLHTRCSLEADGHTQHNGKGPAEFDYQTWTWYSGDRRTYETDRTDDRAWEAGA